MMRGPVEQYLNEIINGLDEAGFFEQSIVTKNTLLKHFLNAIGHNLETKGHFVLSESEISNAYDKALDETIQDEIQKAIQDGTLDITGVDAEGQLTYQLSEQGKEIAKEFEANNQTMIVTAKFERFGDFDPHCLN